MSHLCTAGKGTDKVLETNYIFSLEALFSELTKILYRHNDPERLMKAQTCMESYRGTDWILHSSTPSHKGFEIYGYSRSQVKKQPDLFNMLVLTWSPRSKSAVHNHPCERCFLMPLQGDLAELKYNVNDETSESVFVDETPMLTNRAYWIDDKQGWHSVHNRSCGLSVSLHVYIPSFVKCKIVDPLSGRIKEVSCFPQNTNRVLPLHDRIFEHVRDYLNSLDKPSERPVINLRSVQDIETIFKDKCAIDFEHPAAALSTASLSDSEQLCGKQESSLNPPTDDDSLLAAIQNTLDYSTNTGHLFFFNQLFGRAEPLAIAAEALSTALNPNMLTFETAPVFMTMEKRLLEHLAAFVGWYDKTSLSTCQSSKIQSNNSCHTTNSTQFARSISSPNNNNNSNFDFRSTSTQPKPPSTPANLCSSLFSSRTRPPVALPLLSVPPCRHGCTKDVPTSPRAPRCHWSSFDGIINPGGAMSNIIAMHVARHHLMPEMKTVGMIGAGRAFKGLAVFMSEQGHESFEKGCSLLGFGSQALVRVPVDAFSNRMDVKKLEIAVETVLQEGYLPYLVAAHAGTTVAGTFDDFISIRRICDKFNMWMHIDGTLGASYLLCRHEEPYRSMCEGIETADSLSWNIHKLLGVPIQCSALLTRHSGLLKRAHATSAVRAFSPYVMTSPSQIQLLNSVPRSPVSPVSPFFVPHTHHETGGALHNVDHMSTTNCTPMAGRRADSFKAWLLWKKLGDLGMANKVRLAHSLANDLCGMISSFPLVFERNPFALRPLAQTLGQEETSPGMQVNISENQQPSTVSPSASDGQGAYELVWDSHSVNVCFWWIPADLRSLVSDIKTCMKEKILPKHKNVPFEQDTSSSLLTLAFHLLSGLLPPIEGTSYNNDELVVAVMSSRLLACLDLIAPYIKVQLLAEGSVMIAHHALPSLPPCWRLAIINPDLSRSDLSTVLRIMNRTSNNAFPEGTFDVQSTEEVISMTHNHTEEQAKKNMSDAANASSSHAIAPSPISLSTNESTSSSEISANPVIQVNGNTSTPTTDTLNYRKFALPPVQTSSLMSKQKSENNSLGASPEAAVSVKSVPKLLLVSAEARLGGLYRVPAVAPELLEEEYKRCSENINTCEVGNVDA